VSFPDTTQAELQAALVKRAEILLEAQRAYWDTCRQGNEYWASAAGHRIGEMYDRLWHDIMAAPIPAQLSPAAKEVYPAELAKFLKPLLRHAIRYWELTLMMVERTGVQSDWAARTKQDLERTRALLIDPPMDAAGVKEGEKSAPSVSPNAPTP
jgi:hypothetical protein